MERLRGVLGSDDERDDEREGGVRKTPSASSAAYQNAERSEDVALFVDGPNVLRSEFDVDLDEVRDRAEDAGRVGVLRLYVDEHATPELMQAAEARGYEVRVTSGDVDVKLAVDATELVVEGSIDVLAIASRDTDFKPVLEKAGRRGVRTMAIAPGEHGRSDALQNAADDAIVLDD